jgi:hypothetical protein
MCPKVQFKYYSRALPCAGTRLSTPNYITVSAFDDVYLPTDQLHVQPGIHAIRTTFNNYIMYSWNLNADVHYT